MESFNKFLDSLNHEALKKELGKLYMEIPAVKDYYEIKLSGNKSNQKILKKYQKKIDVALYPDDEFKGGFDLDKVDETLQKLKQTSHLRYYIETGIYAITQLSELANIYGGDFGEDFVIYFEELFEEVVGLSIKFGYGEEYKSSFKILTEMAFEGYGFNDQLNDIFWENY